ncbi:uncharacterized protein LOC123678735 [Harmonia axyridis]|uniref:uncharacterized protein LOC123678735 n=1 Tax=Harmonia axyridis TaxID=115357 RepID=UPI001E27735B|nr:uncharacterized protein LOC123678735 [Harmonia axyridis]
MSDPLTLKELEDVRYRMDVDSYLVLSESLVAFNLTDTTRIRYDATTKPCYNYKVLTMLKDNYGFKYHREFHLGGSGNHNTFVIALHESTSIPVGIKQYFIKKVLQAGLDALGPETKTQTHGIPQGICCDGTQSLKLFAEDAPTVWRRVDAFVRDKRTLANDIVESGEEAMHRNYNPDFKFYKVCFMYYRCKHGILAEPESVGETLQSIISSNNTTSILLVQLHFGTVLYHPTLPLFLHFPTALRKLSKAKEKTFYRCHDIQNGGYITCKSPFAEDRYENISYLQSYDPTYHMIRPHRKANMTLYTIFGEYRNCSKFVKGKTEFMKNFIKCQDHRLLQVGDGLKLRIEFVANFDGFEEALASLTPQSHFLTSIKDHFCVVRNGDDGVSENEECTLGTFRGDWRHHVESTGVKYLGNLIAAMASWKQSPTRDAVRRMYDAEIKLKYFNDGTTRLIDYGRLRKLLGRQSLTYIEEFDDDDDAANNNNNDDDDDEDNNNDDNDDNNEDDIEDIIDDEDDDDNDDNDNSNNDNDTNNNEQRGLLKYICTDEDSNHILSMSFRFQDIKIFYSTITMVWYRKYLQIYLRAADKYDYITRPHLVLMKAIAHMSYLQYGPHTNAWTRPTTKDFGTTHVLHALRRRRSSSGLRWRIIGRLDPRQVVSAIETPNHNSISLFLSATKSHPQYRQDLLRTYIYNNVNYFPAYPITKSLRGMI